MSTKLGPILTILLVSSLASLSFAQDEIHGSSQEDLLAKIAVRDAKWAQEAELAKYPKSRASLVSSLVLSGERGPGNTPSEQFNAWYRALTSLGRLNIEEASSEIAAFTDANAFQISPWSSSSIPSNKEMYPAFSPHLE